MSPLSLSEEHQVNKRLAIIGASGHGKVVAEIAEVLGYEVSFFDDAFPEKMTVEHWPVRGTLLNFLADSELYFGAVVGIGNAKVRETMISQLHDSGIYTPTIQHPSATISSYASIGDGSVIMPGAVINAFAFIDIGCIVNSNAVVEHDCKLARFVHICPNAAVAGGTIIGRGTWVGIGANVRQMLMIGADVLIGAGSAVVNDISQGTTVVGVPAKPIKDKNA